MTQVVTFYFDDVNPLTGLSYARSRFGELPGFAAEVVADRVGLRPGEWDVLVTMDVTDMVLGLDEVWPVALLELGHALAATLHYGELAMAVAWSGADLPRSPVAPMRP